MRLGESEQVQKDLSEHLGINLTVVDASQQFLDGLNGIEEPEKKRKFIGMFIVWSPSYFQICLVDLFTLHIKPGLISF